MGAATEGGTYWDWQHRLADKLLTERSAEEPFVLFIDDDELARLWPAIVNPAESLKSAVARQLQWTSGENFFRALAHVNRDRPPGQLPRTLPLLATTVLAASRMRRDGSFSSNAYFIRLAQELRPELSGPPLEEVKQRLSAGFSTVVTFWREFDQWIGKQKRFGYSTIQDHPRLTRIGYPLSQAIFRESDRMLLTEFFHAMELEERGIPTETALTSALRLWTSRSRGFSDAFLYALQDAVLHELVSGEVTRMAASWDGVVRNPGGKRRLDIRPVIDLDNTAVHWAAALVPEIASDTLTTGEGHRFTVSLPQWGSHYMITGAPAVAALMGKTVQAQGNLCSATLSVPEVFAARESTNAGGWVAVDGIEPREDHVLAVANKFDAAVADLLDEAADEGWKRLSQRTADSLLPGHTIYRLVRLSDPSAFERAVSGLSPGLLRALRPSTPPRPRLVGGLRIAANLGMHHYLRGGEPDLLLPASPDTRAVPASFDGQEQLPPFLATGFALPLRTIAGPIAVGKHVVIADGDTLAFHVHDTVDATDAEPVRASLGWRTDDDSAVLSSAGPFGVAGADVGGTSAEPRLLRRISEWVVIDRYGRTRPLPVPAAPLWPAPLRLPPSQYFEFVPSLTDVWLVEFRHGIGRRPELLRWQEPIVGSLDDRDRSVWAGIHDFAASDLVFSYYAKVFQR